MKRVALTDAHIKYILNKLGECKTYVDDDFKVTEVISIFQDALKSEPYEHFKETRMMPWMQE